MSMMTNPTLQYYLHDEPDAFRLELSGSLSGDGARSVYQAWRTALSIIAARPVVVDITYVVDADQRGRSLLRLWRRRQARIVAASPQSRALAEAILSEPYPEPPARPGLRRRISAFLRKIAASAGLSASAGALRKPSAPAQRKAVDSAALPDARGLEQRVPFISTQVDVSNYKGVTKCFERG
jgi:hypothetical protein